MSTPPSSARAATLRTDLLMLLTAAIWGSTFVAQQMGMDTVGPFTYTGARMVLGADITRLQRDGARVVAVETSLGRIAADAFVVSLGTGSPALVRPLGVSLPVYPLKGYSITVDTGDAPGPAPRVNVTDTARKMVFARIGQRLRVAGMAELVGHNTHIPPARIERLRDAANAVFPGCSHFRELNPWTGMRPATPKGVPLVGHHPRAPGNLLLNTGHGALGFTLAFGTAAHIANMADKVAPQA